MKFLILTMAVALQAQPRPQPFTLPNGLRVVHLEDHQRPLIRIGLHLELLAEDTPSDRPGVAPLLLRVMDRSDAGDLEAGEVEGLLEGAGIQVRRSLGPGSLEWRLLARSRDQDRALGLLADRLLRTVLDPQLLEVQRLACWREEERKLEAPRLLLREALGPDPGLRPTALGLGAITFEDLLTFRARVFRPDRAILAIHGDLGLEQAKRLALLTLGSWSAAAPVAPVKMRQPAPPGPVLHLPARGPGITAQAVAPAPVDLAPESEALLAVLVPGEPSLRPAGMSVEAHCLVVTLEGDSGGHPDELLSTLHARVGALRQRGFSQADLDRARRIWAANRALASLHPDALIETALAEAAGRGLDPDRLKSLSLATLNADLKRWLTPDGFRSGVIAPARSMPRP